MPELENILNKDLPQVLEQFYFEVKFKKLVMKKTLNPMKMMTYERTIKTLQ